MESYLKELIDDFIKGRRRCGQKHRCNGNDEPFYTASLKSLDEVIEKAAFAIDSNGKKCSHQYRISRSVLHAFYKRIKKITDRFTRDLSFDEIYELVASCKIKGIGDLTVYDTSLKIAAFFKTMPDKIYLHAGTKEGAQYLGIDTRGKKYITKPDLPSEFRRLEEWQIEDFLCICKGELKKITSICKA